MGDKPFRIKGDLTLETDFLIRRVLNPFMTIVLKSPLHGLVSGNTMLITFTGRKSGNPYTTPVGYIRDGETVLCSTEANWWKNLRGGAKVVLRIRGRDYEGFAAPISGDVPRIAEGLRKFLIQNPSWARFADVSLDEAGIPRSEDLERAAESTTLIEIGLLKS